MDISINFTNYFKAGNLMGGRLIKKKARVGRMESKGREFNKKSQGG